MEEKSLLEFYPKLHKKYLSFILNGRMPSSMSSMDTNRSVLMYFAISGLDVLGEIENIPTERRKTIIDWIYSLQVIDEQETVSGFQGSTTLNTEYNRGQNSMYKWSHIANTYSSLATLLILKDDLSRVNRQAIINTLKTLQLPDGSFKGAKDGVENDMRFVYCAACISFILNDWSGLDIDKMVDFIMKSISYDGGIAQGPELESHCGSTFCAVASLALSRRLDSLSPARRASLRRWLLHRFDGGFNGRPNKPIDTCYSFWTGGALRILDSYRFISGDHNDQFILMTQDKYGGFSKWVNVIPDPMHTHLGLAGLSLMGFGGLSEMFCELNVTQRTFDHLRCVQANWRTSS